MKLRIIQQSDGKYILQRGYKFLLWSFYIRVNRDDIWRLYYKYIHILPQNISSDKHKILFDYEISTKSSDLDYMEKLVEIYSVLYEINKKSKNIKDSIIGEYNTEDENFISRI